MKNKVPLLFGVLLITVLAYGCGQQSPSMNTFFTQPQGVTLRGTIYEFQSNFQLGVPVADAIVTLDGDRGNWTARANAKGEYSFPGLPDGSYIVSVSKEGYSNLNSIWSTPIKSFALKAADNTITTVNAFLFVFPAIKQFSPATGSVITNNQVFKVTFDKAMDTSTVQFVLTSLGLRASLISGGTVQLNVSWSADNKEATINPIGGLNSNEAYRLMIVPPTSLLPEPYDTEGNSGLWTWGAIFDESDNVFSDYRVTTGGVPLPPANLQVIVGGQPTSELDSFNVADFTEDAQLSWAPSPSTNITGYKIYVARSGSLNNYSPLEAKSTTATSTSNNYFTSEISKVVTSLYGSLAEVNPISTGNYPFINNTVYFRVVAYNGDGESAPIEVSARDVVSPRAGFALPNYQAEPFPGAVVNGLFVPGIDAAEKDRLYIMVHEPVDPATVVGANFALDGGLTIVSARLIMNYFVPSIGSIVEIKASGNLNGRTLTMSNIKDLAGNPVKTGVGDTFGPFVVP